MTHLLEHLRAAIADGRKLLVPYVMGGVPDAASFAPALAPISRAADALEIGLPYSDPLMDGPAIAAAGERAIRQGVGPLEALELASSAVVDCPRVAMTYYNPIHAAGESEFCARLAKAGFDGLIVPDLPIEESEGARRAAADHGLAWVPLVAPTSTRERVAAIAETATGFVYAVSTLGVTGLRDSLSEHAARVVSVCREVTDLPVVVGIGISTPEQARAAAESADGIVVGTAVVQRLIQQGADAAAEFLHEVRAALDT